jgi:uncharacterized protein (AIM24 family)
MSTFLSKHPHLLEVTLQNEKVNAVAGSMVAYDGSVKFEKLVLGGEGLFGAIKRTVTNERMSLMACAGSGTIWFALKARDITVIPLHGQKMFIESDSLLAFDQSLRTSTAFAGLRGAASQQGLFTTTVEGQGQVAIVSDGPAICLQVTPSDPLFVDPDAFLGYVGNITQEFVLDVNWRTFTGNSSGESYQLKFSGQGVVYIQPSER